jgi:UDP-glucose 4-epimerase
MGQALARAIAALWARLSSPGDAAIIGESVSICLHQTVESMRILITGAAGYVGSLFTERFLAQPGVTHVVATDRQPRHVSTSAALDGKLTQVQGRLEDAAFISELEKYLPFDAVIHAAFGVRAGYGRRAKEVEHANIEGCRNVFDLCFRNRVPRLIYFSSAAVYGARPGNTLDGFFDEEKPLREETYPYGAQKRRTEDLLTAMHRDAGSSTRVAIVRPCSITGPRFLSEPTKKVTLVAFLTRLLPIIPEVSTEWSRQYIHEEDLFEATRLLLAADLGPAVESFNLAPHDYLTARDIANALGKRTLRLPAWLVATAMSVLWHLTRGRIPTPPGSIEFYRYPINLDGRKIRKLGFAYRYTSQECLLTA